MKTKLYEKEVIHLSIPLLVFHASTQQSLLWGIQSPEAGVYSSRPFSSLMHMYSCRHAHIQRVSGFCLEFFAQIKRITLYTLFCNLTFSLDSTVGILLCQLAIAAQLTNLVWCCRTTALSQPPAFVNKHFFYWSTATPIHFCVVYSCSRPTIWEVISSCDRSYGSQAGTI